MGLSPTHIIILAVIAVLLFGGGRFSTIMTDVAKGVKGFKKSMADEEESPRLPAATPLTPAAERDLHPVVVDRPA
jgi:sec-independent protein translocase protein TatA